MAKICILGILGFIQIFLSQKICLFKAVKCARVMQMKGLRKLLV